MDPSLAKRFDLAFRGDLECTPTLTLRGGDALDEYRPAPEHDAVLDRVTDSYLARHSGALPHLDAVSWRHYLPSYAEYTLRHFAAPGSAVDAFLQSLRPPDRDPPRLASLTPEQEALVAELLEVLSFDPRSAHQDAACQIMEEWWIPGALYRQAPNRVG